ncbi:MAG TPA: choice-of-anchor D domain-containing protein, partial [Bryobacteraceae bacterium]
MSATVLLLLLGTAMAVGQSVTATASGTVAVGASVTTAALTVTAGASAIDAGSVTVTGVSAPFSVDTSGCASGAAPGASCTMNMTFSPTAAGSFNDSVTVNAMSGGAPVALTGSPVTLSGTGYQPTISPASLLFADPGVGATSTPQTVTVTNTSSTPVTFTLTTTSAYSLVLDTAGSACPTTTGFILGGTGLTSCTVNLVFTPVAPDTTVETGSLTVTYTAGSSLYPASGSPLALTETDGAGTIGGPSADVDLIAQPTTTTLPDGSTVPMWGYSCGPNVLPSTCRSLNPNPAGWSPVLITIPSGQDLVIELTNRLSFSNSNSVPTSVVIVGQLGGGLGTTATSVASPAHGPQDTTWPIAASGAQNVPPPQGNRVQSFSTEVAAGTTQRLVWKNPRPGTYLIESGTHPSIQGPMGLYGMLVVTAAPTAPSGVESAPGCAYPGAAAGSSCVTPYDAEVPLLFSEIDPLQNRTVNAAVNTAGFTETAVWSGQPGGCGNQTSSTYLTCYPPAVNYTPLYYTINGVAFNKTAAAGSVFPTTPATIAPAASTTGSVLVRMVNAGLRMHVPSIVGSQVAGATGGTNPIVTGFKMIAEDGNPLPGIP